ncbi:MAG: hypothetical protein AAFU84_18350, partial [Cyanobacteria bacterium J06633_23]
ELTRNQRWRSLLFGDMHPSIAIPETETETLKLNELGLILFFTEKLHHSIAIDEYVVTMAIRF